MNRRRLLAAAGLAAVAGSVPALAQAPMAYDYLFLDLKAESGAPGRRAFMGRLAATGRKAVAEAGGEVIGVFNPQLGWSNEQTAVLIRWKAPTPAREAAIALITGDTEVALHERHQLRPTVRPQTLDLPKPGGIYVHRWFEIKAENEAEFVRLSAQGWLDFEKRYATNIFGLFAETASDVKLPAGVMRLLLLTRYADHGVWEASRDPTTDAMAAFQRRGQITIRSRGCSTLLAALPA